MESALESAHHANWEAESAARQRLWPQLNTVKDQGVVTTAYVYNHLQPGSQNGHRVTKHFYTGHAVMSTIYATVTNHAVLLSGWG